MTYKTILTTVIACVMGCCVMAQSPNSTTYLELKELPNVAIFLPAPPDTASTTFAGDFLQWQWGKVQRRNNVRGPQASQDSQYGIARTSVIFGEVLGLNISARTTPAIYQLMQKVGETGALITDVKNQQYSRKRPFVQMNEHPTGEYDNEAELRNNTSYISSHTANGWATALVLAEVAPLLQDSLLKAGYEYGMSRVIVSAHWQNSVDNALLAGSAAVARMHKDRKFVTDLEAAKSEYNTLTTPVDTVVGLPQGSKFLPALADTTDNLYYSDVLNYWQMKPERNTNNGAQAILDADTTLQAYINAFAQVMKLDLNLVNIPSITQMVQQAKAKLELAADQTTQALIFRKRPYVKMGETTAVPDDEEAFAETSSYPSKPAQVGWGLALLLAEIAPDFQDEILACGIRYGESSLINGYQFTSDVQAGRILASAVIARLHADSDFAAVLAAAQAEYNSISHH